MLVLVIIPTAGMFCTMAAFVAAATSPPTRCTQTHLARRRVRRYQDRFVAFDVLNSLLLEGVQSERVLLSRLGGGSVGVVRLPVDRVHGILR